MLLSSLLLGKSESNVNTLVSDRVEFWLGQRPLFKLAIDFEQVEIITNNNLEGIQIMGKEPLPN